MARTVTTSGGVDKPPSQGQEFAAAPRSRRATTADQIKEYIFAHGLRPGDPLPTETELCSLLGVSRSSVREAVRTLGTLGIVEVRHGWGTYVGRMSLDALVETLVFRGTLVPGDDLRALREVLEVRLALDLAMGDKVVASLAGKRDEALHDLVDDMTTLAAEGKPSPEHDREFHTRLLQGVDNSLVPQLVAAFWDVHTAVVPRLDVTLPAALTETARTHADILHAAESGDIEAYRAAVHAHYAPIERAISSAGTAG